MDVKNLGTPVSTSEGWSSLLLVLLGVAKQMGWIPEDVEPVALIAAVVLVVNTVIGIVKKATRKGSVPFVADPVTPKQP